MPSGRFATDMTGQQFNYWTVASRAGTMEGKAKKALWNCVCKCGTERVLAGGDLRSGHSKSCGCYQKEVVSEVNSTHGMRQSREYAAWCAMMTRCTNQNSIAYANYGGRGIKVCDRWKSFENFYADMGDANGLTLDRIDVNGNYEPSNCRWATRKEQGNNKRNNNVIEFDGKRMTAMQWSDATGIGESTIRRRLRLGWPVEKALTEKPVVGRNQTWSKAA